MRVSGTTLGLSSRLWAHCLQSSHWETLAKGFSGPRQDQTKQTVLWKHQREGTGQKGGCQVKRPQNKTWRHPQKTSKFFTSNGVGKVVWDLKRFLDALALWREVCVLNPDKRKSCYQKKGFLLRIKYAPQLSSSQPTGMWLVTRCLHLPVSGSAPWGDTDVSLSLGHTFSLLPQMFCLHLAGPFSIPHEYQDNVCA